MRPRLAFAVLNGALMAPLFVASLLVQYNDPDPVRWMVLYGVAGFLCALAATGRIWWRVAVALALVSGLWAISLAPEALAFLRSERTAQAFHMKTGDALEEQARECGGLFLVSIWSAVLGVVALRRAPGPTLLTRIR